MKTRGFFISILVIFFIVMGLTVGTVSSEVKRGKKESDRKQSTKTAQNREEESPCKGFLVIEAETGLVIEGDNPRIKWPIASITKLMLAFIVIEKLESGQVKLEDKITVSQEASSMGGSQVYLKPGEVVTLDEMMKAVMVASANDAAYAVAEFISGSRNAFVDLMNEKARQLNMQDTEFFSPHGLPPSKGQLPDVSSPQDLAALSRELVKRPQLLAWTSLKTAPFRDNTLIMRNHNNLMQRFAGMDGLKTGFYREAGYSIAATAKREDMRLIAVVMGSPTAKVRDNFLNEKLKKAFAQYQMVRLVKKGEQAEKEVALPEGRQKSVRPVAAADFSYPVPREKRRLLTKTYELPDRIMGEVKQGQRLGEIVIRLNNEKIAKVDLISPTDVARKGFISRMLD